MEEHQYVRSETQHRARKLNSSQIAGAGVAHLAYCGSFWTGSQPEIVDMEKMPSK